MKSDDDLLNYLYYFESQINKILEVGISQK